MKICVLLKKYDAIYNNPLDFKNALITAAKNRSINTLTLLLKDERSKSILTGNQSIKDDAYASADEQGKTVMDNLLNVNPIACVC